MGQTIHRALVVDDEPLIREATARALSSRDFCCEVASDGKQALKIHKEHRQDLVITDLRMPNYHGHSLILELLKEANPPTIVVLTGVANAGLARELLARGVHDIVQKPVDYPIFAEKMFSVAERAGWNSSNGRGETVKAGSNHNPAIQKIESSLELFSLCIPPSLEEELALHTDSLCEPAASLVQFLERLTRQRDAGADRRAAERVPVLATAIGIPVNKDFVVKGDANIVTFSDLSEGGACLFSTRSITTEYLALRWRSLQFPKKFLQAVMNIKRSKPLGPFYEMAGPFVMHD